MITTLDPTTRDLSNLALRAATELDTKLTRPHSSSAYSTALAEELRRLFPAQARPQLPPETTGIVCGIVESSAEDLPQNGYEGWEQGAQKIASFLVRANLDKAEIERLVKFCLSLFYATQPKAVMHDIPTDQEHILSMCS